MRLAFPVEFVPREKLDKNPVTKMEGFGSYPYPAGTWSDDTSMSLAALDSLSNCRIDWDEIMKNFGRWLQLGDYTPTGEPFDVGRTCLKSIMNYFRRNMNAIECGGIGEHSNGNGSLMRINPFVLYLYVKDKFDIEIIHNASALTHAHPRSQIACGIYANVLRQLLVMPFKESVYIGLAKANERYSGEPEFEHYKRLFSPDFSKLPREEIKSSGYVVDTLEAAIWCLLTTDNYRECVLTAVNLGGDTDTIAAIAGGLAGALYGYESIPSEWLETLAKREYIEDMCKKFR